MEVNDNRIQKVLSHIRKNIYKTVDIDSLAAISCLSKDHFIRLFKKEVGTTPLQYINQKKIEKAQLILITEDIPVKNIAYLLAYEDHSYFNRLFKKSQTLLHSNIENYIKSNRLIIFTQRFTYFFQPLPPYT